MNGSCIVWAAVAAVAMCAGLGLAAGAAGAGGGGAGPAGGGGQSAPAGPPAVDETPAQPGEWGFRPAEGEPSAVNPPPFVWRPQKGAVAYQFQCARDGAFAVVQYDAGDIRYNCHCPPRTLEPGEWHWRFRYATKGGQISAWSRARAFSIGADAAAFPMPSRKELLARIPKQHPRLFIRPEDLPRLRRLAEGELRPQRDALIAQCQKLLRNPPPTAEPPKYPPGTTQLSEEWRQIWWGNRTYTIEVLNGAATLAFTRLLTGDEEYGRLAKRLLLAAAEWDPKGATGYRYNDEAGMPYNYYLCRTYTFLNDLLSDAEKARLRELMTIRGQEMYQHLCPRHLWQPYGSHQNRAWHKLGEIGIAFLDEIPQAEEWIWFAMNVFYNVYPVWCDSDGGWHEGSSYWASYLSRFSWWADVMRVAMGVDAYKKPFFSQAGYYAMYLQPPGTMGGGLGDLCPERPARANRSLMTVFAAQAANPYWQWYVEAVGGPQPEGGYIGFIRGALPKVAARPPDDLPTSRCFRGTGQAFLNGDLRDARDNVEVIFKSSPFGTQSHGYESNNAFLLYACGQPLLVATGRRDIHGSDHHRNWMWRTKSVNCITVNGAGQGANTAAAQGRIVAFQTSPGMDCVAGEAAGAYGKALDRFTRWILLVKPDLVVVFDRLEAPAPSSFEYWLHFPAEPSLAGQGDIRAANGPAACRIAILAPEGLKLSLTDKYDPPPRARIKVTEWHLTAQTPVPAARTEFVTVIRAGRAGRAEGPGIAAAPMAVLKKIDGGYALQADLTGGRLLVLLRAADKGTLRFAGQSSDADIAAFRFDAAGRLVGRLHP